MKPLIHIIFIKIFIVLILWLFYTAFAKIRMELFICKSIATSIVKRRIALPFLFRLNSCCMRLLPDPCVNILLCIAYFYIAIMVSNSRSGIGINHRYNFFCRFYIRLVHVYSISFTLFSIKSISSFDKLYFLYNCLSIPLIVSFQSMSELRVKS